MQHRQVGSFAAAPVQWLDNRTITQQRLCRPPCAGARHPPHALPAGESDAIELVSDWAGVTAPDPLDGEEIVKGDHKHITPAVEAPNLAFFSTTVVAGHGSGIVIGTGNNTVMGQIASEWQGGTAGDLPSAGVLWRRSCGIAT
jgi:magnesium-transporting ATPase (P-type)